jgi:uncharacterized protein
VTAKLGERPGGEWAVLGLAMVLPLLITLIYFVWLSGGDPVLQRVAAIAGKTVQFALPIVWVGLICRERIRWPGPSRRGLAGGFGFGLLVFVAMIVVYQHLLAPLSLLDSATVEIRRRLIELGVDSLARYLTLGVFYSLIHSLLEEYYWRWFVFGRLRRHVSLGLAITISSVAFAAHHVVVLGTYFGWLSPWTWLFSLSVAVGGAFWAWLYQRSGSLYGPWLSHLLVDAAIFLVGYDLASDLLM